MGLDKARAVSDISEVLARYEAASVSVAVIKDGEIIFTHAAGLQDIASGAPATPETQYAIGSVAKSFTSGLIGTLEEEGLVDLEAHPSDYVPGLEFGDQNLQEDLRVSNLLSQTSGLPWLEGSYVLFPEATQGELAGRLSSFGSSCRVGDCWAYNNFNFIMLDMIAEAVTGQSKSDLLATRILGPVGMANSVSATADFKSSDRAATGYGLRDAGAVPKATEYVFGEQVYASARDLAKWANVWMDEGADVLPADYVAQAISMQAINDGSPPESDAPGIYLFGYGYGWFIKSVDGHYVVHHGGNENGFTAHVLFVPSESLGFVTLTNQQDSLLPNVVNDLLMRCMLGLTQTPVEDYPVIVKPVDGLASPEAARLSDADKAAMRQAPQALVGSYRAEGYGQLEITHEAGGLRLKTPAATFLLTHEDGDTFGLAVVEELPLGLNVDFFRVTFVDGGLTFNLSSPEVMFTRVD
ncbi:serine hydrolase [Henriciella sp. AS95]|uniref:serine hydrolase n=1 Tax=Henriciella sp. AS95 TaxID=3135782 RepID=UPI00317BBEF2